MSLRKYGIILKKYLKEVKPLKYSKLTIDGNKIDEAEVNNFIYSGENYHQDIMVVYKEQWESVFGKNN